MFACIHHANNCNCLLNNCKILPCLNGVICSNDINTYTVRVLLVVYRKSMSDVVVYRKKQYIHIIDA